MFLCGRRRPVRAPARVPLRRDARFPTVRDLPLRQRRYSMIWTITVILLVLWVLGLVSGSTMGAWVHILLVLAIISLIFAVLRRGATVCPRSIFGVLSKLGRVRSRP